MPLNATAEIAHQVPAPHAQPLADDDKDEDDEAEEDGAAAESPPVRFLPNSQIFRPFPR